MAFQNGDLWGAYSDVYALMENISFVKEQYARHRDGLKGLRVILDAGCGIASLTVELSGEPGRTLLAMDNNPVMLRVARHRLSKARETNRVILTQGDVESLPYASRSVEGYVSNNVLYFVNNEQAALAEMSRVVRPGGRACIASARPCMNVEPLLGVMEAELEPRDSGTMAHFEKFASVNCSLQRGLRNLHEPDEFAEQLERTGYWKVVEIGATYLDQDFFVVAMRV